MSEQMYERKRTLSTTPSAAAWRPCTLNVCRVAYHTRDTDEGLRETAMIYLAGATPGGWM